MESGIATKSGMSYVPQIATSIQTAPIVPPGAFPNGQPGTQYQGAEISPIGLKIAEEKAIQTWQQTETERQKQKGKEAAEALQKCHEEGGCGAVGDGVDPKCTLNLSVGNTISSTGKEWIYVRGTAKCSGHVLPAGTQLQVCLEASENAGIFPYYYGLCGKIEAPEGPLQVTSLYAHTHLRCASETTYRGVGELLIPGMTAPLKGLDFNGQCGEDPEGAIAEIELTFLEIFPGDWIAKG